MQRDAHPLIQFMKYSIGGATASVVDIVAFYALCIWVLPAIGQDDVILKILPFDVDVPLITDAVRSNRFAVNSLIAFFFSNTTAYVINIFWVFHRGRHKWYVEMGLFYLVSGISIFIGTLLGYLAIQILGLSTTVSFVTKGVSALLINFVCRKYVIFKG
jgi:putative flippase GtrA